MTILVTGDAGFIGFHLAKKLIENNISVVGIDNLNNYYDVNLKKARRSELENLANAKNVRYFPKVMDLADDKSMEEIFDNFNPEIVINLAAQAGVRHSIENPKSYIRSNLTGFANILENCRKHKVKNFIYASSSSVYGGNTTMPFSESKGVDHPVSLYAVTKRSNELMAHSYSHLYGIPSIGLRFFTVYGPWGRPDMALFLFTKAILEKKPINVFNEGKMIRDFTYVDDIIESIYRLLKKPPEKSEKFDSDNPDPGFSWAPFKVFNIGNSSPTPLLEYIEAIEDALGIKSKINYMPLQPGDVPATYADTSSLEKYINFKPSTSVKTGVNNFIDWYLQFYLKKKNLKILNESKFTRFV